MTGTLGAGSGETSQPSESELKGNNMPVENTNGQADSIDPANAALMDAENASQEVPEEEKDAFLNDEQKEPETPDAIQELRAFIEKFTNEQGAERQRLNEALGALEQRVNQQDGQIESVNRRALDAGRSAQEANQSLRNLRDEVGRNSEIVNRRLNAQAESIERVEQEADRADQRLGQRIDRSNERIEVVEEHQQQVDERLAEKDRQIQELLGLIQTETKTREQEKADAEAKATKSRWKMIIGVAGAAIGFGVALTNPVGWGVILAAGLGGAGLNLASRKMAEKIAIDEAEIARNNQMIANWNTLSDRLGNDTNGQAAKIALASTIETRRKEVEKLEKRARWMKPLTSAFEYAAPGFQGFALGAGFGNFVHRAVENIATQAVAGADGTAGAPVGSGAEAGGTGGDGTLGAEITPEGLTPNTDSIVSQGGHLSLPGSPWDTTVLGMGPDGPVLAGGEWNPSNYIGGDHGMAATFFERGVDASGAPSIEALFDSPYDATRVLNEMRLQAAALRVDGFNPGGVDFAKAYLKVLGKPVPTF